MNGICPIGKMQRVGSCQSFDAYFLSRRGERETGTRSRPTRPIPTSRISGGNLSGGIDVAWRCSPGNQRPPTAPVFDSQSQATPNRACTNHFSDS